jgi:hypothetical protein
VRAEKFRHRVFANELEVGLLLLARVRYLQGGCAATFPPHDNEWRNETGEFGF